MRRDGDPMLAKCSVLGPRPRLVSTLVAVALFTAVLASVTAFGVEAHSALVAATPADGAQVEGGPGTVRAVFNESLQAGASRLEVVDQQGKRVAEGSASQGPQIEVSVGDLPPGQYTVRWAVVSADGHAVKGSWRFTVLAPRAGTNPDAGVGPVPAAGSTAQASQPAAEASGQAATGASDARPSARTGQVATGGTPATGERVTRPLEREAARTPNLTRGAMVAAGVVVLGLAAVAFVVRRH
ncbi:hypothetical protein caldi_22760 [Caldinitratiruptor microaerophilus]|uniref:CopC domain-containing protein n=2 Tax=Caldinitratiruptor microaerophilus TaxID=671077 RepID=A0AA35G6E9_9FIRM|nr:hypothetical protein caldi_22760 [Caldinitratiruptor microaerophilus]